MSSGKYVFHPQIFIAGGGGGGGGGGRRGWLVLTEITSGWSMIANIYETYGGFWVMLLYEYWIHPK